MAAARPIKTHYNGGRVARSTRVKSAAKAAFRRLLDGDFNKAEIINDRNRMVATLSLVKGQSVHLTIYSPRSFK